LTQIESFYPELVKIKQKRSRAEYCWTLTPYSIQYVTKNYNLDACTYLDADIYFFNNPNILFNKAGNNSIIITEHNYTQEYDQTKTSGIYCVQFVFFKNDKYGVEALEWWRQRCKEWCYQKIENGKFGDQKYLDDWTTRFKNVYVPTHIGCGLAPWNIQKYDISVIDGTLYAHDKKTNETAPIIFYHFHALKKRKVYPNRTIWYLGGYRLDYNVRELIYNDYLNILSKYNDPNEHLLKMTRKPTFFLIMFKVIKNIIKSFLIYRMYKYFRTMLIQSYLDERKNTLTIITNPVESK
jgi:hypothetical protein